MTKISTWVFDIDGTLADRQSGGDRGPYNWRRVGEDLPHEDIVTMANLLGNTTEGIPVVVVSGRSVECFQKTEAWLRKHLVVAFDLYMRDAGDFRRDDVVKEEIYRIDVEPKYNILGVFDDRDQTVAMWRRIGLRCYQVAPGDF